MKRGRKREKIKRRLEVADIYLAHILAHVQYTIPKQHHSGSLAYKQ